jgi:hypothetical protein
MNAANKPIEPTSISQVSSLNDLADFWDTHSLADYWDQTTEVHFEVRAVHRHRVTIDAEVYNQVKECARKRGILPETLVNLWLVEKLQVR